MPPKISRIREFCCFPLILALILKRWSKNGAINPTSTSVVAVERNKDVAKLIKKQLKELGVQEYVVLDCDLHLVELEEVFDFVYLDTCGILNASLLNWLCTQVQKKRFSSDCQITVAVSHFARNGFGFFKNYKKYIKKEKKTMIRVRPGLLGIKYTSVQNTHHMVMNDMLRSVLGLPIKSWICRNTDSPTPMHVFSFQVRPINMGITSMLKFLSIYSQEELQILSPGVKAAVKRTKCIKNKCFKKQIKPPIVPLKAVTKDIDFLLKVNEDLSLILEKLMKRVETLERNKPFQLLDGKVYDLECRLVEF